MNMRKGEAGTIIIVGLLLTVLGALFQMDIESEKSTTKSDTNTTKSDTNTTKSVSK